MLCALLCIFEGRSLSISELRAQNRTPSHVLWVLPCRRQQEKKISEYLICLGLPQLTYPKVNDDSILTHFLF
jgi:hypothetical protein